MSIARSFIQIKTFLLQPVACIFIAICASAAEPSVELVRLSKNATHLNASQLYLANIQPNERFRLSDPKAGRFEITIKRASYYQSGNLALSGVTDEGGNFVLIVTPKGELFGSLSEEGNFYRISTKDGLPRLAPRPLSSQPAQYADDAISPDPLEPVLLYETAAANKKHSSNRITTAAINTSTNYPVYKADAVIDVLVYYDENLQSPLPTIDYIFEYANNVFVRSGAELTLRSVKSLPVQIAASKTNSELLEELKAKREPFAAVDSEREQYHADLIHVVRSERADKEDFNCGTAQYSVSDGKAARQNVFGVTEWDPTPGSYRYCFDSTFAHEIGHNIGAAHHREDYSDTTSNAYKYSYGTVVSGSFRTLMGQDTDTDLIPILSSPLSDCEGIPCGVSPVLEDSADNQRTLENTKFLLASYEGTGFDHAGLQFYGGRSTCSADETEEFRGIYIANSTPYSVEVTSRAFLRGDGSVYFSGEFEPDQFVIEPGYSRGWGYCDPPDDHRIGSEVREVFFTYRNPDTGEIVEGTHVYFDDTYDGDYATIRAAVGEGGSVVGNPSRYVRVDERVDVEFAPHFGYELKDVDSTCPGALLNDVYRAEAAYGDCWVVAKFEEVSSNTLEGCSGPEPCVPRVIGVSTYDANSDSASIRLLGNASGEPSVASVSAICASGDLNNYTEIDSTNISTQEAQSELIVDGELLGEPPYLCYVTASNDAGTSDQPNFNNYENYRAFNHVTVRARDDFRETIQGKIQLMYIGLLQRAADRTGLAYWSRTFYNGASVDAIRASFVPLEEFQGFWGNRSRGEFLTALYRIYFNREPDPEGFEYWNTGGGSGNPVEQLAQIFIDAASVYDQVVLENKAVVASHYTNLYATYDRDAAKAILETVDATPRSVELAVQAINDNYTALSFQ